MGYSLYANNTGHQTLEKTKYKEYIYKIPYIIEPKKKDYSKILIIGSGGGNDVSFALKNTRAEITAVEIDPKILDIGKNLHPEKPYSSELVKTIVDDGRVYLDRTKEKYDLVIFALTDSLTLASSYSNTRLESYLYTKEAFEAVKRVLTDDGIFVLYNYYRVPWLVEKISYMVESVFGHKPVGIYDKNLLASIVITKNPNNKIYIPEIDGINRVKEYVAYKEATDNWPFVYMKESSLPLNYAFTLFVILLVSTTIVYFLQKDFIGKYKFDFHFFFMGVGFLLLETKSVVNFAHLFGTTWMVNSLVFFAVLLSVLLANILTLYYRPSKPYIYFILLLIILIVNFLLPVKYLNIFSPWLKYILTSFLTFSPIFIANLIFAYSFASTQIASMAFGANLLGAVLGGVLEYLSMLTGYQNLILIVGLAYLIAYITRYKAYFIDK